MNETNARTSEPGPGEASAGRRLTRRDVVRALGFASVGVAAAGAPWSGVAPTAAQDLGLVATPEAASRKAFDRVGPTVADKAADLRYDLDAHLPVRSRRGGVRPVPGGVARRERHVLGAGRERGRSSVVAGGVARCGPGRDAVRGRGTVRRGRGSDHGLGAAGRGDGAGEGRPHPGAAAAGDR